MGFLLDLVIVCVSQSSLARCKGLHAQSQAMLLLANYSAPFDVWNAKSVQGYAIPWYLSSSNTLLNLLLPQSQIPIMTNVNNAQLPEYAPISAVTSSRDRLSLLPNELLDSIYSLVFQSDEGPWSLRVTRKPKPSWNPDGRQDPIPSILALPGESRYRDRRVQKPHPKWLDDVEEALFRGDSTHKFHRVSY